MSHKLEGYYPTDVKLAEIMERLIKSGWRRSRSKAGTFPGMFITCLKYFVVEDPQLVRVYAELFVDNDSKHSKMTTHRDMVAYILEGVR